MFLLVDTRAFNFTQYLAQGCHVKLGLISQLQSLFITEFVLFFNVSFPSSNSTA